MPSGRKITTHRVLWCLAAAVYVSEGIAAVHVQGPATTNGEAHRGIVDMSRTTNEGRLSVGIGALAPELHLPPEIPAPCQGPAPWRAAHRQGFRFPVDPDRRTS